MPEDGNDHLQMRNKAELFLLEVINKRNKPAMEGMRSLFCGIFIFGLDASLGSFL